MAETIIYIAIAVVIIIIIGAAFYLGGQHPVDLSGACHITNTTQSITSNFIGGNQIFSLTAANPKADIYQVTITAQNYSQYAPAYFTGFKNFSQIVSRPIIAQSSFVLPGSGKYSFIGYQQKLVTGNSINASNTINILLETYGFTISGC